MSDVFSPYQIDFNVKNTSKTFGFSKKKVTFRFGVANGEALRAGQTGANCRGSEHEVIFTWSLNSGKRQILADGKDVHYSETGQNGWTGDQVFQHHFQIRVPGLIAPLRAHLITQPKNADDPRVRPFDLRVNGLSYFEMCKIFQLGTPQMISRPVTKGSSRGGGGGGGGRSSYREENDAYLSPEERKAIAAAKLASLRDLKVPGGGGGGSMSSGGPAPAPPPAVEENLINFLDDPIQAPQPGQFGQPAYSSMSLDSSFGGPPPQAPSPAASYAQQPYSNYSLGAPAAAPPAAPPRPNAFGMQPGPYGSQSSMYASQSSMGSSGQFGAGGGLPPQPPAQPPAPYGAQPYYHQQPPPAAPTSSFGSAPPAQALASPSNASYQSYGSAPTFAQPPPPQQQQQQQYQHQQQPQNGAPQGYPQPPPQGYPQYY